MASTSKWSVLKFHDIYQFSFSTGIVNCVTVQLHSPLLFNPLDDSITGSNGVVIRLDASLIPSIVVSSTGLKITSAGIGLSESAFADIQTYIYNKSSVEHHYSD